MTSKEKFLQLAEPIADDTIVKIRERIKSRAFLRESQNIAITVLEKLRELQWTQKMLAEQMQVSPQQITKIVSGRENLTLETIVKLQQILNVKLLHTAAAASPKTHQFSLQKVIVTAAKPTYLKEGAKVVQVSKFSFEAAPKLHNQAI